MRVGHLITVTSVLERPSHMRRLPYWILIHRNYREPFSSPELDRVR